MSKAPPIHELEFLKISGNHRDFTKKLGDLGISSPDLKEFVHHVGEAWFRLGEEHLAEAKKLLSAGCPRATYSRAYYAAYNASKGTRYIAQGFVSLKGDDHGKASTDLPGDFPNLANWGQRISMLYEHRLHADYDNWTTTAMALTLAPAGAISDAEGFIEEARKYLKAKHGVQL